MRVPFPVLCGAAFVMAHSQPLAAQQADSMVVLRNDSISVRFVDVDLRAAVQALGRYLDQPIVFGAVNAGRVTLETPHAVARTDVVQLLRGMLESQNLALIPDSGLYRIQRAEVRSAPAGSNTGAGTVAHDSAVELFVIRLRHADAVDVAGVVNALYGRASALGELGSRPSGPSTLSQQLEQSRVPPVNADGARGPARPLAGGRAATLTGEVVIVPDVGTNSLLVRATKSDFDLINAAVQQLDIRPLEVLIEVLIAEVRRDRGFNFGVEGTLPETPVRGSSNTKVAGSMAGLGLGDLVLRVMNLGSVDFEAVLQTGVSRGDVSIISRPVVIAANNETAEIMVGSQRPFVQVSRSLPTQTPTRDQVIQYRDVGTRLSVRPTISQDGYVMLKVTQEVNAATSETEFDAPVISTRSVETRLLVKDGQTVVLGGLTDRQRDRTRRGIPILSSIPLLGGLFGSSSHRLSATELFLLITPHVIRTDAQADTLTAPVKKRAEKIKP